MDGCENTSIVFVFGNANRVSTRWIYLKKLERAFSLLLCLLDPSRGASHLQSTVWRTTVPFLVWSRFGTQNCEVLRGSNLDIGLAALEQNLNSAVTLEGSLEPSSECSRRRLTQITFSHWTTKAPRTPQARTRAGSAELVTP